MTLECRNVAFALGVKGGRIMVDDHGKEDGYSLMHQMLTKCIIIKLLTNSNDEDDMYIYIYHIDM